MSDDWKEFTESVKPIPNNRRTKDQCGIKETSDVDKKPETSVSLRVDVSVGSDNFKENKSKGSFLSEADFSRVCGSHIKKLKKGNFSPEDIIDLHGMRLNEAEKEFFDFIDSSYTNGHRYLLVITGKGKSSEGGVSIIRESVPKWLNSGFLSDKILAFTFAHKKHGGEGAYYILLKK